MKKCGCSIKHNKIIYCHLHASAATLLHNLKLMIGIYHNNHNNHTHHVESVAKCSSVICRRFFNVTEEPYKHEYIDVEAELLHTWVCYRKKIRKQKRLSGYGIKWSEKDLEKL